MTECDTNSCIRVNATGPIVRIESTETGDAMYTTREEWKAFLDRVKAGEFDVGDGLSGVPSGSQAARS